MIEQSQHRMNRSTAAGRVWFTRHRERIARLLGARPRGSRLCVLGAGNCNDLDLPALLDHFAEIHLVDLDPASVRSAVEPIAHGGRIILHAPVDVTGIAAILSGWTSFPRPTEAAIDHALALAALGAELQAGPFDTVLSPCVLSQLLVSARGIIGARHPRYPQFVAALRLGHMRLIRRLLEPRGQAILLLDAVSSERADRIPRLAPHDAAPALAWCLARSLHLQGLEPAGIEQAIAAVDPAAQVSTDLQDPWVWHLGERKSFLVYACQWLPGNPGHSIEIA